MIRFREDAFETIKHFCTRYLLLPFAIATALIALAIVASSCHQDDRVSKVDILVASPWRITKYELGEVDITNEQEACDVDNSMIFQSNGDLIDDVGDIRCHDQDYNAYGTWKFKADERIIRLHPSGELALDWKVVALTDKVFKIKHYFEGMDAEAVITLTPQ